MCQLYSWCWGIVMGYSKANIYHRSCIQHPALSVQVGICIMLMAPHSVEFWTLEITPIVEECSYEDIKPTNVTIIFTRLTWALSVCPVLMCMPLYRPKEKALGLSSEKDLDVYVSESWRMRTWMFLCRYLLFWVWWMLLTSGSSHQAAIIVSISPTSKALEEKKHTSCSMTGWDSNAAWSDSRTIHSVACFFRYGMGTRDGMDGITRL